MKMEKAIEQLKQRCAQIANEENYGVLENLVEELEKDLSQYFVSVYATEED